MSHSNANFRNVAGRGLAELKYNGGRFAVDNGPRPPQYPPFLDLACGVTLQADLTPWQFRANVRSFFRTSSLVTNQNYYARQGHLQLDSPTDVEISVTSAEFEPYVALVRNSTRAWFSTNGVIQAEITEDDTGPFVVEVTSVKPLKTGRFTISVRCGSTSPYTELIVKKIQGYQFYSFIEAEDMVSADFETAWPGLRDAVNGVDIDQLADHELRTIRYQDGIPLYSEVTVFGANLGTASIFGGLWPVRYGPGGIVGYYLICERCVMLLPTSYQPVRNEFWKQRIIPPPTVAPATGSTGFPDYNLPPGFGAPSSYELTLVNSGLEATEDYHDVLISGLVPEHIPTFEMYTHEGERYDPYFPPTGVTVTHPSQTLIIPVVTLP